MPQAEFVRPSPDSPLSGRQDSPLSELGDSHAFIARHVGPDEHDRSAMLRTLGFSDIEELIDAAVPASIRSEGDMDLAAPSSEVEVLDMLREMAGRNRVLTSLIGMGYTNTVTPPVIRRNVLESPAWYTAYTPYQPEISQGRLEALLNFQTVFADLTGMDLANASLLDEATAAAEAMTLALRQNTGAGTTFVIDPDCHPQTAAVIRTRAEPLGIDVVEHDPAEPVPGTFAVLVQYPGSSGAVRDLAEVVEPAHAAGALVVVAADPLAVVALRAPGEVGADVVVGSAQRFGVPMGFGGPHAGFMATRESFRRTLPGRLVGVSVDASGRTAYRLALQTREQHIRREKATSNICTAQVLLAVVAGLYATYHGPDGLARIAARVHRLTTVAAVGLRRGGVTPRHDEFFDTLTLEVPGRAAEVLAAAREVGLNLRPVDGDTVGLTFDETSTPSVVEKVWEAFGVKASVEELDRQVRSPIPPGLRRDTAFLTHPTFHAYRSETEMLRYLRRLSDKDLALDRAMIPLGSCTMKLNATAEMEPISWPGFADVHPFVPADQAEGYRDLVGSLEQALAEVTGFDAVSLQPNAGSQGELAGLLAIRAWHRDRGEGRRDVCLIPASAHGTNAASAVMAGMRVVVVACDDDGNVDLDDLKARAEAHSDDLSCLMVTYPSTHGVFETAIEEICDLVHRHGGQVYLDGANLNALVGIARPGRFGADVSHLNLHKTFCIPHGGGGPGVGPVAVRAHLARYLPNHPVVPDAGPATGVGPVAAAPWGSAGILPISWAYIRLMGGEGLLTATQTAILAANYLAHRLRDHFPVLYSGEGGLVAHECILDLRPITRATGTTVDDVAKRLIDYGFHAPTMSFPVAGTLMVEPTESESLSELDRFCDAMIAIRTEIDAVAEGRWPADDNPLVNAPHTALDLLTGDWPHPYSRELAAYPDPRLRDSKYWAPVSRIDGAYGDRNVFCSCPMPEEMARG